MPLNGSGTFTRLYNWVTDRNNSIKITASRMDGEFDGIATALSSALYRDGQQINAANQNWGGYRITNLGDATSDADALNRQSGDARYIQQGAGGAAALAAVLDEAVHATTDVASAATTDLGASATDRVRITGTTTITSLGTGANRLRFVHFAATLTLTHNASSLILPSGSNIVTAAGDAAIFSSDGSGNWRCLAYQKATGDFLGPVASVASASTTDIGIAASSRVQITGTTTITSFGTVANSIRFVHFAAALTLTHNATTLILPGGANITTAAGDCAIFSSDASGNWRCLSYQPATGYVRPDVTRTLTAGFSATPFNAGTQSSGTFTPNEANGNLQFATNGGAHTLAPPTNNCTIIVQYTNNASAGAITTSGFTRVTGSAFTTVNGDDFMCYITRNNGFTLLNVVALQ